MDCTLQKATLTIHTSQRSMSVNCTSQESYLDELYLINAPISEASLDGLHLTKSYLDGLHLTEVCLSELHLKRVLPWWTVSHTGMAPDPRHLGEPPGPCHARSPSPAAAPLALASTAPAQSSSSPWCVGCSPQTRRAGPGRWGTGAAGRRPCSAPPGCHDAAAGTAGADCSRVWETTAHRTYRKSWFLFRCACVSMHACVCVLWGGGWGGGAGMDVCNNDWFLSGYIHLVHSGTSKM